MSLPKKVEKQIHDLISLEKYRFEKHKKQHHLYVSDHYLELRKYAADLGHLKNAEELLANVPDELKRSGGHHLHP